MTPRTLPIYRGPRCECGAGRRPQDRTCRKCSARSRWLRRSGHPRDERRRSRRRLALSTAVTGQPDTANSRARRGAR